MSTDFELAWKVERQEPPCDTGGRERLSFGITIAQEFVSGESAPISPMLFAVKDGAILDIAEAHLQGCCDDLLKDSGTTLRSSLEHQNSGWPTPSAARPASMPTRAAPVEKPKQSLCSNVVNWLLLVLVLVLFWQLLAYFAL